jgi:hypothetical protein
MQDIIKQGDWGYGDTTGLAKEVDAGYKKWLKKNGLEPEGYNNKKNRMSFNYGKKSGD